MTSYCFKILVLTVLIVKIVVVTFYLFIYYLFTRFHVVNLKKSSRPGYLIYILFVFLCSDRQALGVPFESKL